MNTENDQTAERFLVALEDWVQELLALSQLPLANPTKLNFEDYTKFRDKKDECLSFMVIIERRIGQGGGDRKERLTEQFDRLVVAIWSILMQGSFGFLTVLCERAQLPIGTKFVFEQELKTLYEAEKALEQDRYQKFLPASLVEQREKAKQILNITIEKAPKLLKIG